MTDITAAPSLATGDAMSASTWADFVNRLRHDCLGAGVRDHCTAAAIFLVEKRTLIYGLDADYCPDKRVVLLEDSEWFSPREYWDDLDEEERAELDAESLTWCELPFLEADENDQWEVLGDRDSHTVTGWDDRWEYVNAHFTKDAADAFIRRKKHDYPKGMRVYVECQNYAWEFEAVKTAILNGTLTYTPKATPAAEQEQAPEDASQALASALCQKLAHIRGKPIDWAEAIAITATVTGMSAEEEARLLAFDDPEPDLQVTA